MSILDRDEALKILKRCFPKADDLKIIQHQLADGDSHFTSNVTHFAVEYKEDDNLQQKQVVLKVPNGGAGGGFFESFNCFDREISLYEVVLPKVTKYLDKSLVPAHLYTTDSKILVLEDVTAQGYESGEKIPFFNLYRTKSVLKALAQFHAASHKLHEKDPHFLQHLLSNHFAGTEVRKNIVTRWEPFVLELLKFKNETSLIPRVRAAIAFLKKDDDKIRASTRQSKFKFVVLDHGDCRKENMLLKLGDNDQVEGVQFIDFQFSLWSSPLLDIFYFFVTSVSVDVIQAHYDELIDEYLLELNEKLKKLHCCSSYNKADLNEDFRNLRFFLFFCVFHLCVLMSLTEAEEKMKVDVADLCDLFLNNDSFVHAIYGWLKFCDKRNVYAGY